MDRDRVAVIAQAFAAMVEFELLRESDSFCGRLTVTADLFRTGVTGIASDKHRSNGKEALAALNALNK